jgi:predicted nucleic acid-binding protein
VIVVDTNVIAYLLLPGDQTAAARRTLQRDPRWAAPLLWRSELRNVLATAMRRGHLALTDARDVMETAGDLMVGGEFEVASDAVLRLAARSNCSAYDCEFVALAQELGVVLVTSDQQIVAEFADTAQPLTEFGGSRADT